MKRTKRFGLLLALACTPARGEAQALWDSTALAALFAGHRPAGQSGGYREDWFQAAQGGVIVGRHVLGHLKVELEATATSGGSQFVSRPITLPGQPYPYWLTSTETTSVRSVGAVAAWQFRDNEWVHPFVLAGVTADFDRTVAYTPEQFFNGDPRAGALPQRLSDGRTEETTAVRAGAVIGGGAKLYFREHAFVRSDVRLAVGRDQQNVAFRAGVGLDF